MRALFYTSIGSMILVFSGISPLFAQSKIRGLVADNNKIPIANANVLLLKANDSSLVKGVTTKETGAYTLENIPSGRYLISASFIGYEPVFSSAIDIVAGSEERDAGVFMLQKSGTQLAEVSVSAKKPLFEQKVDRMVINVKSSITSAGTNALQVLEKSPGVSVNRQNSSISMNGKNGIIVMINGKRNYMPLSAVFQLLEGMSANNIEKIELITTPPSSMDAEGNAGFINIVMAVSDNFGTNGSYFLSAGYGYGGIGSAGINFNHRKEKINFYGDFSISGNGQAQYIDNYRKVANNGNIIENFTHSDRDPLTILSNARLGLDYQLNNKTIVGALVTGYFRDWTMDAISDNSIYKNGLPDTLINTVSDELNRWQSFSTNVNMQHRFTNDEMLTVDLDYVYYHASNPINYLSKYYNGSGAFLFDRPTKTDKTTPIIFYVGKADYTKKLHAKISLEAGVKAAFSTFNNDVVINNYTQGSWIKDETLSAKYKLKETVAAAYTAFNFTLDKKTTIKAGLRYEYTVSNLGSEKEQNIVDRKYGNLFPTFFASHKINDNNSFGLAYSRRINRPTFTDMAPFLIYLDPNTFFSGNSKLQPSLTDAFSATYSFKSYILSVSYSYDNNPIAGFQNKVDSITNKQTVAAENLDNMQTVSFTLTIPFQVSNWWVSQNSFTGNWQRVRLIYNKAPVSLEQTNYSINSTQTFNLPKNISLELSFEYQSPSLMGTSVFQSMWQLGFGAQKKLGNKGTIRLNANNIFDTYKYRAYNDLPEQNLVTNFGMQFMPRNFTITWSRSFGNDKLTGKRNRSSAADDEKNRVRN